MHEILNRITKNPKSTCIGVLLGVTTVAGTLSAQGVTLGRAGNGTRVALVSALATALMGLLAKD